MKRIMLAAASLILLSFVSPGSRASDNKAMDADILTVAEDWAKAKYLSKDDSERKEKMEGVAVKADALVTKYPGRVEALIWDGIVTSEQASLASVFSALSYANKARDLLNEAYKMDPKALDAGAPTSLGVLYYRVPGFPIAFGDTSKARQYLQKAIANAPNGMDANYFYGDFLYQQHEYAEATKVLKHALALPAHRDRPIWDRERRLVIQELLAKMQQATR